jgi:putative membrane protein
MAEVLVVYLHYAAMVLIAVLLTLELQACVPGLADAKVRVLARIDFAYLAAALLALATGLARLFWYGKGLAFYAHNPVLYIKLALFVAVALISLPPTMQMLRWVRALKSGAARVAADYEVARMRRYMLAEVALFALIPLMAVLMARGIGVQAPAA